MRILQQTIDRLEKQGDQEAAELMAEMRVLLIAWVKVELEGYSVTELLIDRTTEVLK